jgi:hypothetical protein
VQRGHVAHPLAHGLVAQRVGEPREAPDDDGLTLDVVADQEPQVDIWGAERRTELFEKVFGMPVQIRWAAAVKK